MLLQKLCLSWPSVGGFCRSCVAFGLLQPLQIPLVPSQEPGQAPHLTLQHITALHCNALHYTALHRTAQQCRALTALHRTAPYCTALHSTLHCTAFSVKLAEACPAVRPTVDSGIKCLLGALPGDHTAFLFRNCQWPERSDKIYRHTLVASHGAQLLGCGEPCTWAHGL